MLSKKFRLSRKQVNFLHRKGRSNNLGNIAVKTYPNKLAYSRFSVVIPKSLLKKTVERNRLRRIIFDELALFRPTTPIDCLIRLQKVIPEESLRKQIKKTLGG